MGRDYDREETSAATKLTYLIVGGGIGAVLALLFAPKSGVELREDIADATRKGIEKSKEAAAQFQEIQNDQRGDHDPGEYGCENGSRKGHRSNPLLRR